MSRRRPAPEDDMDDAPKASMRTTFTFESDDWARNVLRGLSAVAGEPRQAERYQRMAAELEHQLEKGARGTSAHAVLQITLGTEGREAARQGRPSPHAASRIGIAWKAVKLEARW